MPVWLSIISEFEMARKRCSNILHLQKRVINMIWLVLNVFDWPIMLICPGGLLLVVPHYLLSQFQFYCSGLYISSRHVKSVHLHANFISQISQVALFLQVSVFHPGFISLTSWGWLWVQFSFILGLFKTHFMCFQLFHRIPWTIHDEVKHVFHLPFDWIIWNPMDEFAWFLLLLLPCWCLHYIQKGCLSQQEVYATLVGLCWVIGIFFKRSPFVLHVFPVPTVHWTIFWSFVFIDDF